MIKRNVALFAALALLAGAVQAQSPVSRLRGSIEKFDGSTLSVKAADGTVVDVQLGEKTEIVFTQAMKITDVKPGDFLALTSMKGADGSLTAFEVRRFPKALNPGHRPFEGRDDQTMTNATLSNMVQSAKGSELTVTYDGGAQKIVVPADAALTMLVPAERSALKPGAPVNMSTTAGADGRRVAQRIQVSAPK